MATSATPTQVSPSELTPSETEMITTSQERLAVAAMKLPITTATIIEYQERIKALQHEIYQHWGTTYERHEEMIKEATLLLSEIEMRGEGACLMSCTRDHWHETVYLNAKRVLHNCKVGIKTVITA